MLQLYSEEDSYACWIYFLGYMDWLHFENFIISKYAIDLKDACFGLAVLCPEMLDIGTKPNIKYFSLCSPSLSGRNCVYIR